MNYFTVRVLKNGSPEEGIEVAGELNHFVYAGQTNDFYTDSDGYAILEWEQDTYLDTIYIDGEAFECHFYDGESKDFSI